MKSTLLLFGAMLALASSLALCPSRVCAQGDINIAWNDCVWYGFTNISPGCLSNNGMNILVASFSPPADMPHFNGHASVLDIKVASATLDPWWHMEPGGCRAGRMTASFDFTTGPFSCNDVWAGAASGGLDIAVITSNQLRVRTVSALPGAAPIVADGTE